MAVPNIRYFRDDLRMTTWLLVGACIQVCLSIVLTFRVALMPTTILLLWRLTIFALIRGGALRDSSLDVVHRGKFTAQIPHSDGTFGSIPSSQQVIVMILGARSSHVQGRFAPGFKEMGDSFGDMWREASRNRGKWGYLGKTSTLFTTDQDSGNSMIWISYWKSLDHLQAFALGPAHKKGWEMFNKGIKKYPHIGLMHEMYNVPKGHWETIYFNFKPFGLGQTKYLTDEGKDSEKTISSLIKADDSKWGSMKGRLGHDQSL